MGEDVQVCNRTENSPKVAMTPQALKVPVPIQPPTPETADSHHMGPHRGKHQPLLTIIFEGGRRCQRDEPHPTDINTNKE